MVIWYFWGILVIFEPYILVILSVGIQWEDLWNSYIKKSFEIHEFGPLKSWMDLTKIQILMILSHPNKEFGFRLSNPNPWAQIHPIQTNHLFLMNYLEFIWRLDEITMWFSLKTKFVALKIYYCRLNMDC